MQHEISFIGFAHVSSLFLRRHNRILASKSANQQKKLSKLDQLNLTSHISVQDSSKIIFNCSKYEPPDCEKRLLAKGLTFRLAQKYLDYVDYLVSFEFFYRNIRTLAILSHEDLDFVKTRTKVAALSSYRNCNNNVLQHLSKKEFTKST